MIVNNEKIAYNIDTITEVLKRLRTLHQKQTPIKAIDEKVSQAYEMLMECNILLSAELNVTIT